MTKKPVSNIGASVRQRLLNLRDQTGEDAQALFTQFAIERFLYRLSRSSLADQFVLKGAMLFHFPKKLVQFGDHLSTPTGFDLFLIVSSQFRSIVKIT